MSCRTSVPWDRRERVATWMLMDFCKSSKTQSESRREGFCFAYAAQWRPHTRQVWFLPFLGGYLRDLRVFFFSPFPRSRYCLYHSSKPKEQQGEKINGVGASDVTVLYSFLNKGGETENKRRKEKEANICSPRLS